MAKPTASLRRNLATAKVTKLQQNVVGVTRRTLYEAAVPAQKLISDIMYGAETQTGRDRVSSGRGTHTGRYETGAMIKSIENQRLVGPPMQTQNMAGQIVQKIGTSKPVPYMKYQEVIDDMRAIHKGGTAFMVGVLSRMELALREAGRDAEANRTSKRIERFNG